MTAHRCARNLNLRMDNPSQGPGGVTESERLLFQLCRRSFLQLWSYVNVFRDQGKTAPTGDGKEMCDVLVVFGDVVILFSDKSCRFPQTGKIELDWSRWRRRAIRDSQDQLRGAERWIRRFPERVFMDPTCTKPLHAKLPAPERMRVYRIAVALGASDRCRQHYGDGSGSLPFVNLPNAGANQGPSTPFLLPFVDDTGGITHIVDDVTLPILLRELDTISDFIEYLNTKEKMIRSGQLLSVAGEEDLVGLFLGLRSKLPDFAETSIPGSGGIHVAEGLYGDILSKPDYLEYLRRNSSSYFWDELIDRHTTCALDGTLVEGSVKTIAENEAILRILAAEPRVYRRLLADAYLDLIAKAPKFEITSRTIKTKGSPVYVFQVHPRCGRAEAEYREDRQAHLHAVLYLTAWRNQKNKRFVGIVTDGGPPRTSGYEVMVIEADPWTPETLAIGAKLSRELMHGLSRRSSHQKVRTEFLRPWTPVSDSVTQPDPQRKRFKTRPKRRGRKR